MNSDLRVTPEGVEPGSTSRRARLPGWAILLVIVGLLVLSAFFIPGGNRVDYVRIEYVQSVPDECTGVLTRSGVWESATIEVWGPDSNGKARLDLTYPDGSSEVLVIEGLLTETGARKIWSSTEPGQPPGSQLLTWSCVPPEPIEFTPEVEARIDHAIPILGLFVSMDLVMPGMEENLFVLIQQQLGPDAERESIDGVESSRLSSQGPPEAVESGYSYEQVIWVDLEEARLQQQVTRLDTPDGVVALRWTVVERGRENVGLDHFSTRDIPLFSVNQGL